MTDRVFTAEGICKSFGRRPVLRGASIWASAGKTSVMMGCNGTGKTTLLRCALGLMEGDVGAVRLLGAAYRRPRLYRLARRGLFFLPTERLISRRVPFRIQLAAAERARREFDSLPGEAIAAEAMGELEIDRLLDAPPQTYSGGEMRRAELAMALTRAPLCLLADEPFHGIAPIDIEAVSRAITRLARAGCAVVVTGHEVPELLDLADEVIWLTTGGSTHGFGSAEEARAHHLFRREYLAGR